MSYSPLLNGSTKRTVILTKDSICNSESVKFSKESSLKDNKIDGIQNGFVNHLDYKSQSENYIGFSNLPNQVYQKAVRRGFEFNLMVVGESGLGKSTFINSLFLSEIYNPDNPGPSLRPKKTTSVQSQTVVLKEQGIFLRLQLVDTPGFGDSVDNTNCWQPILDYICSRFDDYISCESRVERSLESLMDQRIHALVYFIAPTGHRLKQLDIEFLTRIQDKVNVIPVIAKADTLTVDECREFKKAILEELKSQKVQIFEFPDLSERYYRGNEEELIKIRRLRDRAPFAIVGANTLIPSDNGNRIRARSYPWGVVEVENMEHNDFAALRYLILTAFMQELRDVTHYVHYENYRGTKLSGIAIESHFQTRDGKDPMAAMEAEKKEHEAKMRKMEAEMEAVFEQKVNEKNQKLREFENDLIRRAEQMREQLRAQEQELEASRVALEAERVRWEETWREWDVASDVNSTNGSSIGLGERVLNEVIKERAKTDKKRKGLF